jgi:hypothetical protein
MRRARAGDGRAAEAQPAAFTDADQPVDTTTLLDLVTGG